jgi:hypothetical protein
MLEELQRTTLRGKATHQALVQASVLGPGDRFVVPSLIEAQEHLVGVQVVPKPV